MDNRYHLWSVSIRLHIFGRMTSLSKFWVDTHSSYDWSWTQSVAPPGGYGAGGEDRTDVRFYGDVFAGLAYDVSDSFKLFAGVRYIFMNDMNRKIDVTGVSDYSAGINNDVLIELGARYRF